MRISANSGITEHGGVRERGVEWELGGILGSLVRISFAPGSGD